MGKDKKLGEKKNLADLLNRPIVVVYKHSWLSHAEAKLEPSKLRQVKGKKDPWMEQIERSHQENLDCLSKIESALIDAKLKYRLIARQNLSKGDLDGHLVFCVGGDGTVLSANQFANDSILVGVNSDPTVSVGALCGTNKTDFVSVLEHLKKATAPFLPIYRLNVMVDGNLVGHAVNDMLLANKNPAGMTRYRITYKGCTEVHRGSGIWLSTAMGSSGGIYSSGASAQNVLSERFIFRAREPYSSDVAHPTLLKGDGTFGDIVRFLVSMMDAEIFIDGPHQVFAVEWGSSIEVCLDKNPLWLYYPDSLFVHRQNNLLVRDNFRTILK